MELIWLFGAVVLLMLADGFCMADGKLSVADRVSALVVGDKGRWIATGVHAAMSLLLLGVVVGVFQPSGG